MLVGRRSSTLDWQELSQRARRPAEGVNLIATRLKD